MKNLYPPIILLTVCTLIGGAISFFSLARWLTSSVVVLIIMLLLGTWVFEDDARPGGQDHDEKAWKNGSLKKIIRKNGSINYSIILVLMGALVAYEILF